MPAAYNPTAQYDVKIWDEEFRKTPTRTLMARIYQPQGPGPFPVLLDLHGTNHDSRRWRCPHEFRPQRFAGANGDPFDFVPQGGGIPQMHHRCPGEGMTVELMKQAVWFLLHRLRYEVPAQNLDIDRRRLPALPASRFRMTDVRLLRP